MGVLLKDVGGEDGEEHHAERGQQNAEYLADGGDGEDFGTDGGDVHPGPPERVAEAVELGVDARFVLEEDERRAALDPVWRGGSCSNYPFVSSDPATTEPGVVLDTCMYSMLCHMTLTLYLIMCWLTLKTGLLPRCLLHSHRGDLLPR